MFCPHLYRRFLIILVFLLLSAFSEGLKANCESAFQDAPGEEVPQEKGEREGGKGAEIRTGRGTYDIHELIRLKDLQYTASLNAPVAGLTEISLQDSLPDQSSPDPEKEAISQSLQDKVDSILQGLLLKPVDWLIIRGRWMAPPGSKRTLKDIAQELGMSHQAVQMRAARLQRDLRKHLRHIYLDHFGKNAHTPIFNRTALPAEEAKDVRKT